MGDKHCFAVGTVGGDIAVDVREIVFLVRGHCPPRAFAFGSVEKAKTENKNMITSDY
jgi:hypothetical protein